MEPKNGGRYIVRWLLFGGGRYGVTFLTNFEFANTKMSV